MIIAGIDPGKHKCAVAWANRGEIRHVYLCSEYCEPGYKRTLICVDELWCEVPRVYPGVRAQDPNDLIQVAIGLGRAVECFYAKKRVDVYPREWKGTIKKEVMTARIKKILTASGEIKVLDAKGLENDHNCLDACGIALYALGRLSY